MRPGLRSARSRLSEEVRILLVPKQWTIRRGKFAGAHVPIDPSAALRRLPGYGAFGRVSARHIVGWMPGSFPIPVVLRHDGPRITTADSVAFWDAARDVDSALGGHFFVPWTDTAMYGRIFPVDVRIDRRIPGAALTFATWDANGNIFEGTIGFHGSREMQIPGVVEHELMHVLGFGHTKAWTSAMADDQRGRARRDRDGCGVRAAADGGSRVATGFTRGRRTDRGNGEAGNPSTGGASVALSTI